MQNIVTIPRVSARTVLKKFLPHPNADRSFYVHPPLREWDYFLGRDGKRHREERGQRYEAFQFRPRRRMQTEDVRDLFRSNSVIGCMAAHIEWIQTNKQELEGFFATVPDDDRLIEVSQHVCAPYYYRHVNLYQPGTDEGFYLNRIREGWGTDCVYVGYRLISP